MRRFLIVVLAIAMSAVPAHAQFIGFTAPQTVQQQLGSSPAACSTTAQDYPVQNLGQTEHYLTVLADGMSTQFTVNFFGLDVNGRRVNISDEMDMAAGTAGSLFASGYYPKVVVEVVCQPATATYTLTYSGAWGTPPATTGNYMQTQIAKELFNGISVSGGLTYGFIPPFGSSAGVVFFRFNAGNVAGSTISVRCQSSAGGTHAAAIVLPAAAIPSDTNLHDFQVGNFPCPIVSVVFTGGSGSLVYISYIFGTPGMSSWPIAAATPLLAQPHRPSAPHRPHHP